MRRIGNPASLRGQSKAGNLARYKEGQRIGIPEHYHRGLEFKKLPPHRDIWSVRVTDDYRAVGQRQGEVIVWFFIGTHAEYDALLARL